MIINLDLTSVYQDWVECSLFGWLSHRPHAEISIYILICRFSIHMWGCLLLWSRDTQWVSENTHIDRRMCYFHLWKGQHAENSMSDDWTTYVLFSLCIKVWNVYRLRTCFGGYYICTVQLMYIMSIWETCFSLMLATLLWTGGVI